MVHLVVDVAHPQVKRTGQYFVALLRRLGDVTAVRENAALARVILHAPTLPIMCRPARP